MEVVQACWPGVVQAQFLPPRSECWRKPALQSEELELKELELAYLPQVPPAVSRRA